MTLTFLGAVFVITGCVAMGILCAQEYQQTVNCFHHLLRSLEQMECELSFSSCSLPDLFHTLTCGNYGQLKKLWIEVSEELDSQIVPDAETCMRKALTANQTLPNTVLEILDKFAECLGKYDLNGQLQGLSYIQEICSSKLRILESNMNQRIRSYKVFGLCGGIVLVLILI